MFCDEADVVAGLDCDAATGVLKITKKDAINPEFYTSTNSLPVAFLSASA
jgi:hypothetical protein